MNYQDNTQDNTQDSILDQINFTHEELMSLIYLGIILAKQNEEK